MRQQGCLYTSYARVCAHLFPGLKWPGLSKVPKAGLPTLSVQGLHMRWRVASCC